MITWAAQYEPTELIVRQIRTSQNAMVHNSTKKALCKLQMNIFPIECLPDFLYTYNRVVQNSGLETAELFQA